ncbi:MAG TPA: LysR family transcriptional regulator [Paucimonas sp.]|nr:LysR family transcriptional regulator [Paucimonas sp.]
MHLPNLTAIQAFRRVVETRSFAHAGADLGMTGSAVSKLVARLEADLGTRLLMRTTRVVNITEAGNMFYESALRILNEMVAAQEQLASKTAGLCGSLRMSVPSSFALMCLSPRLPRFLDAYPELALDLALNDRFVDLVQEGFDGAIRIATGMPDSTLVAKPLGTAPRVTVASPRYLESAPPLDHPRRLSEHRCLIYSLSMSQNTWTYAEAGSPVAVEVSGKLRINNSVMLRSALTAGRGVALTPRFVVADLLASGELMEVLEDYAPPPHTVYGVVTHQKYLPRKVAAFFEFVKECL